MDNYFSWKVVQSITYQKHRKPSTFHRAPTTRRAVWREGWPVGRACPSAIIFLTLLAVKKMSAISWIIENTERTFLYYSSHCYNLGFRMWTFFLLKYRRQSSTLKTQAFQIKVVYKNHLILSNSCTEVFYYGSASCRQKLYWETLHCHFFM